jgi:hypothetical protein
VTGRETVDELISSFPKIGISRYWYRRAKKFLAFDCLPALAGYQKPLDFLFAPSVHYYHVQSSRGLGQWILSKKINTQAKGSWGIQSCQGTVCVGDNSVIDQFLSLFIPAFFF